MSGTSNYHAKYRKYKELYMRHVRKEDTQTAGGDPETFQLPYVADDIDSGSQFDVPRFVQTMRTYLQRIRGQDPLFIDDYLTRETKTVTLEKYTLPRNARVATIGDIHGGLCNLVNFIKRLVNSGFFVATEGIHAWKLRDHHYIVSLGDLVDRGPNSIEVIDLLFTLKVRNWESVHIVNGNHEDSSVYNRYGFIYDLQDTYIEGESLLKVIDNKDSSLFKVQGSHYVFTPFSYLPAVIFLAFGEDEHAYWSQFCHGGINNKDELPYSSNTSGQTLAGFLLDSDQNRLTYLTKNSQEIGYKWSDFQDGYECNQGDAVQSMTVQEALEYINGRPTYGRKETSEYLETITQYTPEGYNNKPGLECIFRGHQDLVNGFMVLPRMKAKMAGTDNGRLECTAYLYPVGRYTEADGTLSPRYGEFNACKNTYDDRHLGSSQLNDMEGRLTIFNGQWDTMGKNISLGSDDANFRMIDDNGYKLCVPIERTRIFKSMFDEDGRGKQAAAIRFSTEDTSVITTATCQQAKHGSNEAGITNVMETWLLITRPEEHPEPPPSIICQD